MYKLLLICLLASPAFAADELAMTDLAALAKQQSWTELLDKADRVRPSARTADWNRLVLSAATHVLDRILHDSRSDLHAAERLISIVPAAEQKYDLLRSSKPYLTAKAAALARVVAACTDDGCGWVLEVLADGIDRFPKGVARKIAVQMSADGRPAVRFWALAAAEDKDVCTNGRLERAVIDALHGSAQVADAQRAAGLCYATLEIALVRELDSKDDFAKHACPVLKTHGTMTVAKKKRCP